MSDKPMTMRLTPLFHAREDYRARVVQVIEIDGQPIYPNPIPSDEPVFLLRARDVCAAATVRDYGNRLMVKGVDPALVKLVHEHAERMEQWPGRRMPDLPVPPPADDGESVFLNSDMGSSVCGD